MHKFVRELITEWRRLELPFEGAAFVVAVSGGADSVSLLLALEELRRTRKLENRIVAAHFNHKLRGDESDTDEEYVKHLAGMLKVELSIGHARLLNEGNIEQNARIARYEFLTKIAESIDAQGIITAHTQNDQAETFLMNLIRGSGPEGLGGIKPIRSMSSETPETGETRETTGANVAPGTPEQNETNDHDDSPAGASTFLPFVPVPPLLVRPLLNWAQRHDTEGYCRDRNVEYRYDSMNENLSFTRVRIRKLLLPMLEEFNPKIVQTLSNTARLMRYEAELGAGSGEDQPIDIDDELSIRELDNLDKARRYRLLRAWLKVKRGSLRQLELKHIAAIERLVKSRKSGHIVELPGNKAIVKKSGRLVYTDLKVEKSPSGN